MSVTEEIRAAIEKLLALAYSSSDGPWDAHIESGPAVISAELFDADGAHVIDDGYVADVELIAVLHRTIDAQFAILRDAVDRFDSACCDRHGLLGSADALALARAITGVTA